MRVAVARMLVTPSGRWKRLPVDRQAVLIRLPLERLDVDEGAILPDAIEVDMELLFRLEFFIQRSRDPNGGTSPFQLRQHRGHQVVVGRR